MGKIRRFVRKKTDNREPIIRALAEEKKEITDPQSPRQRVISALIEDEQASIRKLRGHATGMYQHDPLHLDQRIQTLMKQLASHQRRIAYLESQRQAPGKQGRIAMARRTRFPIGTLRRITTSSNARKKIQSRR